MTDRYLKGSVASKILNVHPRTLYQWDEKGWIETKRTQGNMRLYNVDKYLRDIKVKNGVKCYCEDDLDELDKREDKININYVRVSSHGQKDDLERQTAMIMEKYPDNILIKDIGSGLNMNKPGLNKIIKLAIKGKINKLVVVYKDRLTRFGYELLENLIKDYSNGEIIIMNKKEDMTPEEEMVLDMMQIMNVFIAKMNGLRKYKKLNEKN
jgi:predicted site-specific integrase-resolvase